MIEILGILNEVNSNLEPIIQFLSNMVLLYHLIEKLNDFLSNLYWLLNVIECSYSNEFYN